MKEGIFSVAEGMRPKTAHQLAEALQLTFNDREGEQVRRKYFPIAITIKLSKQPSVGLVRDSELFLIIPYNNTINKPARYIKGIDTFADLYVSETIS